MPARPFRLDVIKLILWTIGGGLILFALWGSVLTLQGGRFGADDWARFYDTPYAGEWPYGLPELQALVEQAIGPLPEDVFVIPSRDSAAASAEAALESGRLRTVVDRTFPLAETPGAFRYLGEGPARGKIVVTL